MIEGGNTYYYHSDGLGSITEITDELGNLVERYEYDVFGRVSIKDASGYTLQVSSIGNPYYFTGRRYDTETGLYFFRTRYYNTDIGRFIQPDAIGYKADVNLYTYCHNNPINYIDPYGTCDWEWWRRMIEDVMRRLGDLGEIFEGVEIQIPLPPGEYNIGGQTVVVKEPGTTVQVQFGEGGITDVEFITSSDFTVVDVCGPVDVDIDFAYYNPQTGDYNVEGRAWGIVPVRRRGQF